MPRKPKQAQCQCEEPGTFDCGYRGVLCNPDIWEKERRVPQGRDVQRCDTCRNFHSDEQAYVFLIERLAGQIVATPGALQALEAVGQAPLEFLQRHVSGDWGDLCDENKQENEFRLKHGFRILSAYHPNDGTKLWIITEADRSATTLLLPSEY